MFLAESNDDTPHTSHVNRRGLLRGSVAVAATSILSTLPGSPPASATTGIRPGAAPAVRRPVACRSRPNILVIMTDDQPKGTDWAMAKTREWLVGRGVELVNGHATTPLCAPSRASTFSGCYAHNHGVRDNIHAYNLDQSTTMQRYLQQAGYRTALFGKFPNSWAVRDDPPHFDEWVMLKPHYNDGTYNVNGTLRTIPGYTTDVIRDRMLDFLDRAATDSRPWFAHVSTYASHEPNTPERKYAEAPVPPWDGRPSVFETDKRGKPHYVQKGRTSLAEGQAMRQRQLRVLLSVDDAVQAIHDKLAAVGQLDNTLVFYTSDNGFHWADYGLLVKATPYSQVHEVPFYMSWPAGGLGDGTVDERIAANIDIAPTVLHAAGITPDTPQDGRSLLSSSDRDHILIEWWKQENAGGPKHTWASYVSTTRQYTEYYDLRASHAEAREIGTGRVTFREYYDLAEDPYQLTNRLYQATPTDEQRLKIPELAAQLAADRRS